jgi:CRISPR-associated protein Cas4
MEREIPISYLNDFIFCPRSIYFHQLHGLAEDRLYKQTPQIEGTIAHKTIENRTYTTASTVLQGIEVYCEQYGIYGKIDTFDTKKNLLTERKKKIKVIYDGYIFQLYAQYFCLKEMGYKVDKLKLYSMDDNKSYPIELPENDLEMLGKFETLIDSLKNFSLDSAFQPNINKCRNCIYRNLCDYSLC